ncbi:MAG: hypothetical protein QOD77_32 [Thermoplasmata archaeon]|jgi:SAM-dependent methyltransferase|nr:hypothetical protein [Thermoplasmata archaeon]
MLAWGPDGVQAEQSSVGMRPETLGLRWARSKAPKPAGGCPACGDATPKPQVLSVASVLDQGRLDLYACPCGSVYFHPFRLPAYDQGAEAASDYFAQESGLQHYVEWGAGISFMVDLVATARAARPFRSMLEVGCGYGLALDAARRLWGTAVVGCEPGYFGREGRARLGLDIHHAYVQDVPALHGRTFDFVFCSEVIEHVSTPVDLARLLGDYLAPDGLLVLTTPNAQVADSGSDLATLVPNLSPGYHVLLFGADSLAGLLRRAGFAHVVVLPRNDRLIAFASRKPFATPRLGGHGPEYLSYLERFLAEDKTPDRLRLGVATRLAGEHGHAGRHDATRAALREAKAAAEAVHGPGACEPAEAQRRARLATSFSDWGRHLPYCIGNLLYHDAMLALNADGDQERACRGFHAAAAVQSALVGHDVFFTAEAQQLLPWALFHAGWLDLRLGRPQQAIQALQQVLAPPQAMAVEPVTLARTHHALGQAWLALGKRRKALRHLRAAQSSPGYGDGSLLGDLEAALRLPRWRR